MTAHTKLTKPAYLYPWDKRTLFIGALPGNVHVAYSAATLVVSLGNMISFSDGHHVTRAQSFLLPPGHPVSIDAGNNVIAICHLDVLGKDFAQFQGSWIRKTGNVQVQLKEEEDYFRCFKTLYRHPSDSDTTFTTLDRLLAFGFMRDAPQPAVDTRVATIIDYIKCHYQENLPINTLAGQVDLSVPRLVQIFKHQTGVPIRRFRLWHRLYETLLMIAEGYSFTEAALSAGFSDSPHYTRAFASLWGVNPSVLFSKGISVELIPPARD